MQRHTLAGRAGSPGFPLRRATRLLLVAAAILMASSVTAQARRGPDRASHARPLHVELFPFVSTSFVEIFPEDFTDPASPLFGESPEEFLARVRMSFPFVFPVRDEETGEPISMLGGNLGGEPAVVEKGSRIFARVGVLGRADSPSGPLRFNGLIDSPEARAELAFFEDRVLRGPCGRPQHLFPVRYGRSDVFPKEDSLTKLVGLDIDGDPTNCAIQDDPQTPEDEALACDAENIPGPDAGADITREDWRPRSPVEAITLGRFMQARGFARVTPTRDPEVAKIRIHMQGLIPGQLYSVFEVDTDPLGRPLPQAFPLGGVPDNLFKAGSRGHAAFQGELIHNPLGAELVELPFPPPIGTVELPKEATVAVAVIWQANAQNNGGISFSTDAGGRLDGG